MAPPSSKKLLAEYVRPPSSDDCSSKRPALSIASYVDENDDDDDDTATTPKKRRRLDNDGCSDESKIDASPYSSRRSNSRRTSSVFLLRLSSQKLDVGEHRDGTNEVESQKKPTALADEDMAASSLEQLTDTMGDWSITNLRCLRRNNIYSHIDLPQTEVVSRARSDVMRMLRRKSSSSSVASSVSRKSRSVARRPTDGSKAMFD